jgi:tetratricopeptide (TPR) repeat protein
MRVRRTTTTARRGLRGLGLVLGALLALLAACQHAAPQANVPVQKNAAAQFAYAEQYKSLKNLDLIGDKDKMLREREVVRQTYLKVAEYFPDDRQFAPLAQLTVIEMDGGLDMQRAPAGKRRVHDAIERLQALARDYPDHVFVQVKTLYDQGLCHKRLGEYADAQVCFQEVCQEYAKNPNEAVAKLAERACFYYNQTYVNE